MIGSVRDSFNCPQTLKIQHMIIEGADLLALYFAVALKTLLEPAGNFIRACFGLHTDYGHL
jgi:hypothetical protein